MNSSSMPITGLGTESFNTKRDRLANGLIHQQERDGAEHYRMRMTR
jgi:hypothetical protein